MLKCSDKAASLRGLGDIPLSGHSVIQQPLLQRACVFLDGMGFVRQPKMKDVIKLEDLVGQVTLNIEKEISGHSHAILVFDNYDISLAVLKQATWDTRHMVQVQYKLTQLL